MSRGPIVAWVGTVSGEALAALAWDLAGVVSATGEAVLLVDVATGGALTKLGLPEGARRALAADTQPRGVEAWLLGDAALDDAREVQRDVWLLPNDGMGENAVGCAPLDALRAGLDALVERVQPALTVLVLGRTHRALLRPMIELTDSLSVIAAPDAAGVHALRRLGEDLGAPPDFLGCRAAGYVRLESSTPDRLRREIDWGAALPAVYREAILRAPEALGVQSVHDPQCLAIVREQHELWRLARAARRPATTLTVADGLDPLLTKAAHRHTAGVRRIAERLEILPAAPSPPVEPNPSGADEAVEWRRYWLPRDLEPEQRQPLVAGGFLVDPEGWRGPYVADALFDRVELHGYRSLILLGEPGSGKTTELAGWRSRWPGAWIAADLIDTPDDLAAELADAGLDPETPRPLYIDGLDESPLFRAHPRRFFQALGRQLDRHGVSGLRVTCRSSAWSGPIRAELSGFVSPRRLGAEEHRVFDLAPLTRADVRRWAAARLPDPDRWLAAIDRRQLGPMAAHLFTLTQLYLPKDGAPAALEQAPVDLWAEALRHLCRFPDKIRPEAAALSPAERFEVAAFVAAARILTGRAVIVDEADRGRPVLTVDDLARYGPHSPAALRETLLCPLFTTDSEGSRFIHDGFAEYLAAHWLARREVPGQAWRALVNAEGRVPEPLFETALWLGQMLPAVGRRLRAEAPLRVLGRRAVQTPDERLDLLDALIARHRRGDLNLRSEHNALMRLAGPGIEDRITALLDESVPELVEAGADLARYSRDPAFAPRLLEIALDTSLKPEPRVAAMDALSALPTDLDRSPLRDLLQEEALGARCHHDPISAALRVLWPDHLTTEELLAHLGGIRGLGWWNHDETGLADSIPRADLPHALSWALDAMSGCPRTDELQRFARRLSQRCWENTGQERAVAALARAFHAFDGRLEIDWSTAPEKRAMLLRVVAETPPADGLVGMMDWRGLGLITLDDVPFLLDRVESTSDTERRVWLYILQQVFRLPEHRAYEARARRIPQMSALLDHREAQRAGRLDKATRLAARRETAEQARRSQTRNTLERTASTVDEALAAAERGDDPGWVGIETALQADVEGWWANTPEALERLTPEQASRLVALAMDTIVDTRGDLRELAHRRGALAWNVACALAPERIEVLPPEAWDRWLPALLGTGGLSERFYETVGRRAPESMARAWATRYRDAISDPDGRWSRRHLVRLTPSVWSPALEAVAVELLRDEGVELDARSPLLGPLFDHDVDAAERFAQRYLDDHQVAWAYLRARPDDAWSHVWPRLTGDPEWGRALWRSVDDRYPEFHFARRLSPVARAQFIWWLSTHFEWPERPSGVVYTPTKDQEILSVAGDMKRWMVHIGDVEGLTHLVALDDTTYTRKALAAARRNADAEAWRDWTLADLQTLTRTPRTSAELAEVVVRALEQIQVERLDGEHSEPASLWDRVPSSRPPTFRPKPEDDLSYWLRNRLADGLPVDVRIARETDMAGGRNRTDLRISRRFGDAELVVVLEAKGCWHREAVSAARTQLVDTYLARVPDAAGIHLIWWFDPARWDESDSRRGEVRAAFRTAPNPLVAALAAEVDALRAGSGRAVFGVVLRVSDTPPPLTDGDEAA